MPASSNLLERLNTLQQLLVLYQTKSKELKQPSAPIQQQITQLERLYQQVLQTLAVATLAQAPQEEDWVTLLNQADLPKENKEQLGQLLAVNPKEEEARAYIEMVVDFYRKYYSNQQKYAKQLDFGIDISPEQYQDYLQQAITFTIKKKGKAATAVDFSTHFVLLLKGFLKENALKKGEVQYTLQDHAAPEGTTFTITTYQLEEEWSDMTAWLNKKPPFAKSPFNIDTTTIAVEVAGTGSLVQEKTLEAKENLLGDFLTVTGEALCQELEIAIKDKMGNASVALTEGKLTFNLPLGITIEVGVKIADVVSALSKGEEGIKWESSITPIEIVGQLALDLKALKALVTDHPFWEQLLDLKLKVEFSIATELGVDLLSMDKDKLMQEAIDALDKKEQLVTKKQLQLLKQQEAYLELAEQTAHSQKLYQERQQLLKQATVEVDPKKKKALQKKAFDKAVHLQKERQRITQRLQEHQAISLEDLDKSIQEQSNSLKKALQKNQLHLEKVTQKIEDKTQQLLLKAAKRQSTRRLLSLVAKTIPVINVISTLVDIYDAVVFLNEMRQLYQQKDLELPHDEQLEQIENAAIDVTTLSPMLTDFFYAIGAGGKLLELTPEEAEELTAFLEKEFSEGMKSVVYVRFCMAYGDHYEVVGKRMEDTRELIDAIKLYKATNPKAIESVEAKTIPPINDLGPNGKASTFFHRLNYVVMEGDATTVGGFVLVDASGIDTSPDGQKKQISFYDEELLKLEVVQDIGDQEMLLQPIEHYSLEIKFYRKENVKTIVTTRTYTLSKTSKFVYHKKSEQITIKPLK